MKIFSLSLLFLILSFVSVAQVKYSISGTITDSSTGEDLIGSTIYIEQTKFGMNTNNYGYFSLSLKPGIYDFVVSFLGFESQKFTLSVDQDINKIGS
jgi:hypothetical protein